MVVYIIIGPQAVGKMTVGQSLSKLTGAKLFHNHMTIDLVENFFPYGSAAGDNLVKQFRRLLFEAVSREDEYPGFIFTYVCDFDSPDGLPFLMDTCRMFADRGHRVIVAELYADQETRRERNITENRRIHKKQKADIEKSKQIFERFENCTRATSKPGEVTWELYCRIDNTQLPPEQAAAQIAAY